MEGSATFVKVRENTLQVGEKEIPMDYVPKSIDLSPHAADSLGTWDVSWRAQQEQRRCDPGNRNPVSDARR